MAGDAESLLNMLPTARDNFLAEDIKHLKSLDYEDFVDPTPDSVDAILQFLDVGCFDIICIKLVCILSKFDTYFT